MQITAQFPKKLKFLFDRHRYKGGYGGRGSGKSWGFARALAILGLEERLRILCTREIQKSIKDSVHKLLKDQIQMLGLGKEYTATETEIKGRNGTEFIFSGLSTQTVESIKSYEAIDICWVEEAQVVSKRSWDVLIPTIRKENSEIWVSFNPDLETDPTYQRFITNPPTDSKIVEINWRDNPWFPEVLKQERLDCLKNDPDNYDNIWEGKCRPAVEGAIYFNEIKRAQAEGRICNVPYDPSLKVHVVLDLGWNDSLAAGLVQKGVSDIRIIEYLEASRTKLEHFSAELRTRSYNWGKMWIPHDGFSGRLESGGLSTADIMSGLGWSVPPREEIVEKSVEEGIRTVRHEFDRIYFDKSKCAADKPIVPKVKEFGATNLNGRLVECLKRYRRRINKSTEAESTPVDDEFAHGADMFRYIANNVEKMKNSTSGVFVPRRT